MGFLQEFKDFALKGNVIDLAVGLIIGAEFGKIVNSVVNDVIMPPIGKLIGGVNFVDLKYSLGKEAVMKDGMPVLKGAIPLLQDGVPVLKNGVPVLTGGVQEYREAFINYGNFIQTVINFTIIAFCVFLIVKAMNTAKKTLEKKIDANPATTPEAPADIKLLTEIRDLLQKKPV